MGLVSIEQHMMHNIPMKIKLIIRGITNLAPMGSKCHKMFLFFEGVVRLNVLLNVWPFATYAQKHIGHSEL